MHRKRDSQANAAHSNNIVHVAPSGISGGKVKKHLSILPTMFRTFGLPFLFGAILKFIHDVLQFVSPQILRYVNLELLPLYSLQIIKGSPKTAYKSRCCTPIRLLELFLYFTFIVIFVTWTMASKHLAVPSKFTFEARYT